MDHEVYGFHLKSILASRMTSAVVGPAVIYVMSSNTINFEAAAGNMYVGGFDRLPHRACLFEFHDLDRFRFGAEDSRVLDNYGAMALFAIHGDDDPPHIARAMVMAMHRSRRWSLPMVGSMIDLHDTTVLDTVSLPRSLYDGDDEDFDGRCMAETMMARIMLPAALGMLARARPDQIVQRRLPYHRRSVSLRRNRKMDWNYYTVEMPAAEPDWEAFGVLNQYLRTKGKRS